MKFLDEVACWFGDVEISSMPPDPSASEGHPTSPSVVLRQGDVRVAVEVADALSLARAILEAAECAVLEDWEYRLDHSAEPVS